MNVRIGQPIARKEDGRLITGRGRFSSDLVLPDLAHAAIVRSPHAHARVSAIGTEAARAMPGVLGVFTAIDLSADGVGPIPHVGATLPGPPDIQLTIRDEGRPFATPHVPLASGMVRFVGEPVAVVIAETAALARDAAESVLVDYEPLPSLTDSLAACLPDSPRIWPDGKSNIVLEGETGDAAATELAFAQAAHVVSFKTWVQRVTPVPMEPRAAIGVYDKATGRHVLHAGSGNVVRQRRELALCLGVPEDAVRVISGDVGGNFGTRNAFYPEFALVVWAAKRLGRPVKWTCERSEALTTDYQARDLHVEAELALDRKGKFLALRATNTSNAGAYAVMLTPLVKGAGLMTSLYSVPVAHVRARSVITNTPPTNSYRSSGRPEAIFVMERLIDLAAREHGFDRVKLRRLNLVAEAQMPYSNPLGLTYDNGAYELSMDKALALGDWSGFSARRKEARRRGRLRGIAVANYVEIASGMPRERAEVTVKANGRVEIVIGTLSSGQGHETSFAQLITEWLGVPFDCVDLVTGDTDRVVAGGGSHAGRSMRLASIVIGKASQEIITKGRAIAASLLGVEVEAIAFRDGRFTSVSDANGLSLADVATALECNAGPIPHNLRGPLSATCDETVADGSYPYGSQVCEVEIDPDTGHLTIVRYVAIDDVGRAVNPLIVEGQTHGGIVQGVGQALLEQCVFEPDSGQNLTGSFMDYAMPRAGMMPSFITEIMEVPASSNPHGIRAGSEGGTTPALAVIINAIVDALAEYGVTHVEMPATPNRIWQTIQDARRKNGSANDKGTA
jgi:carbon-monoxide dehydrogenase large subunit